MNYEGIIKNIIAEFELPLDMTMLRESSMNIIKEKSSEVKEEKHLKGMVLCQGYLLDRTTFIRGSRGE